MRRPELSSSRSVRVWFLRQRLRLRSWELFTLRKKGTKENPLDMDDLGPLMAYLRAKDD